MTSSIAEHLCHLHAPAASVPELAIEHRFVVRLLITAIPQLRRCCRNRPQWSVPQ